MPSGPIHVSLFMLHCASLRKAHLLLWAHIAPWLTFIPCNAATVWQRGAVRHSGDNVGPISDNMMTCWSYFRHTLFHTESLIGLVGPHLRLFLRGWTSKILLR